MIDRVQFEQDMTALMDKLRERLGVRGRHLRTRLRRAGRGLPKHARRSGEVLIMAERHMAHPKLRQRIDTVEVANAFADLHTSLAAVDPKDRRRGAILGMAGGLVFNLMLAVAALVAFLAWRGLV